MQKDNKIKNIFKIIFFSVVLLLIIALFFIKLWYVPSLPITLNGSGQEKEYVVKNGETIDELANQLSQDKMIRSAHQLVSDFTDLQDAQKDNNNAP